MRSLLVPVLLMVSLAFTAHAQTADPSTTTRLTNLERVVAPARADFSYVGFGPVASKIYDGDGLGPRFGIGADFASLGDQTPVAGADSARRHANVWSIAPTFGYRPHRRLIFNAQLNFETGGAEASETVTLRKGAAVVRFAYLDWRAREDAAIGVRVGHQLVPLGITNTSVDALTFFGVRRPPVERDLLPADWHENGVLLYRDLTSLAIEAGVFAAPNARGFRGETFLAGGRAQGQRSAVDDAMAVARVNYHDERWRAGGSLAFGSSAQGDEALPSGDFAMGEVHARLHWRRLHVQVEFARGRLDDAALLSTLNQTSLGSRARGDSVEAGVQVLPERDAELWVFVRFAKVNLNDAVSGGTVANPLVDQTFAQVGAHYRPLPGLVVKADLTRVHRGDGTAAGEAWLGAGLVF